MFVEFGLAAFVVGVFGLVHDYREQSKSAGQAACSLAGSIVTDETLNPSLTPIKPGPDFRSGTNVPLVLMEAEVVARKCIGN